MNAGITAFFCTYVMKCEVQVNGEVVQLSLSTMKDDLLECTLNHRIGLLKHAIKIAEKVFEIRFHAQSKTGNYQYECMNKCIVNNVLMIL